MARDVATLYEDGDVCSEYAVERIARRYNNKGRS